jgi:hypothetical protein
MKIPFDIEEYELRRIYRTTKKVVRDAEGRLIGWKIITKKEGEQRPLKRATD